MTSFTRKLFNRDPAAAEAFHRQSAFEKARGMELSYGKNVTLAQFTQAYHPPKPFGRRKRLTGNQFACAASCGHPACAQGCIGIGR